MLFRQAYLYKGRTNLRFISTNSLYIPIIKEDKIFGNGIYNLFKYRNNLSLNDLSKDQLEEISQVKKIPLGVLQEYKTNYEKFLQEKKKNTYNPIDIFIPNSSSLSSITTCNNSLNLPSEQNLIQFSSGRFTVKSLINKIDPTFSVSFPLNYKENESYPNYPPNITASLSHKDNYISSIVLSPSSLEKESIGIDIENIEDKRGFKLSRKILTEEEIELIFKSSLSLSKSEKKSYLIDEIKKKDGAKIITLSDSSSLLTFPMSTLSFNQQILIIFSIKEAFYKAIYPYHKRYIGFQEVEVLLIEEKMDKLIENEEELETRGTAKIFFNQKQFNAKIEWKTIKDAEAKKNLCLSFVHILADDYQNFMNNKVKI